MSIPVPNTVAPSNQSGWAEHPVRLSSVPLARVSLFSVRSNLSSVFISFLFSVSALPTKQEGYT
jgi:hypothetical protein